MSKYSITAKGKKANLRIIGDISWWKNNSERFTRQVDDLIEAGVEDVETYINSGGGFMFEANEIRNQIRRFKGQKDCKLGALCASAATSIACEHDTVVASPNTMYMIHNPILGTTIRSLLEIDNIKLFYTNLRDEAISCYKKFSGQSNEALSEMMDKETWLSAQQAKDKGFVNRIEGEDAELPVDATNFAKKYGFKLPEALNQAVLKFNENKDQKKSMKKIAAHFGLGENATEDEILAAIQATDKKVLVVTNAATELLVVQATAKGLKAEAIEKIAKLDFSAAVELVESTQAIEPILDEAKPEISNKDTDTRISEIIANSKAGQPVNNEDDSRKDWTLLDWEKKDPEGVKNMIRNDFKKYQLLFKNAYGFVPDKADVTKASAA